MKAPKSYEEGLARLNEILTQLSDESTPLSQAVNLYADAAKLIDFCNNALQDAKVKVDEIDAEVSAKKEAGNGL